MKKVFNMLVTVEEAVQLEKVLNTFRIGMNDWDKSKVFELRGYKLINYTLLCEEDLFVSITNVMNGIRVY